MSKWVQLLATTVILFSGSPLQGDDGYFQTSSPSAMEASDFPLNPDQGWYTKETYLLLKPYLDDIDYATKGNTEGSGREGFLNQKVKYKRPDFDWYSSARLAIGRYLPNHAHWDISLTTTYFYANETGHSSANTDQGNLLGALWVPNEELNYGANTASNRWKLTYFTWDLSAGREYQFLQTVVARPYIGLRTALMYQDYQNKYFYFGESLSIFPNIIFLEADTKFKAEWDYWGVGPRAGVDLQFNFGRGWLLLGGFSGSLFYGKYSMNEKLSGVESTFSNGVFIGTNSSYVKSKDSSYCVRANLEGSLGLGWERWVRNKTVRIAPSILFEATQWFDANQYFLTDTSGTDAYAVLTLPFIYRHYGDLGLVGFSFNLQVDF